MTSTSKRQRYSDQPTTTDELGFKGSADALLGLINAVELEDTPLTIGIFGPWGSGKTSLMQMLHQQLDSNRFIPIWFDAWRYSQEDALWRALLLAVVEALRNQLLNDDERLLSLVQHQAASSNTPTDAPDKSDLKAARQRLTGQLDDLVLSLYRSVEREELGGIEINWREATKTTANIAVRLGLSFLPVVGTLANAVDKARESFGSGEDADRLVDIFQRERSKIYREQVRSLEQFYGTLKELVEQWIVAADLRLIIFIDDLDRCLPDQSIGVLEAIKVFLDLRSCLFVLGVDRAVIERGIRIRYKEFAVDEPAGTPDQPSRVFPIEGRDYLEKIVQVPFDLPPIETIAIERFLKSRLTAIDGVSPGDVNMVAYSMSIGLLPNPRKVKRAMNTFRLLHSLAQTHQRTLNLPLLAKLVVLQNSAPSLYEQVIKEPVWLQHLEQAARGRGPNEQIRALLEPYDRIHMMLGREPFFGSLTEQELSNLIFQTRVVQSSPTSTRA